MSSVFQSEARLAVYALRRDSGCSYARRVADWTRALPPWSRHPRIFGRRLELLGVTPADAIAIPEELDALIVEPLPERERDLRAATLEPLLSQLSEEARITGLLLRQVRPAAASLSRLLAHPWRWLDLGELALDAAALEGAELGALQGLRLGGPPSSLAHLSRASALEALSLTGRSEEGVTPEQARELPETLIQLATRDRLAAGAAEVLAARLGRLRALRVTASSAAEVAVFASCALERVELRAAQGLAAEEPPDQGIARLLPSFTSLRQLSIHRAFVGAPLLRALSDMEALEALRLTQAQRELELGGAFPDVLTLDLELDLDARDEGCFDALTRLEALRVESSDGVRGAVPRPPGMSFPDWARLREAALGERLPLCALLDLPAPERLRRLEVAGLSLQPHDEEVFAEFPELAALSARDLPLRRIDPIAGLPKLRELQLDGTWLELRGELAGLPLRTLSLRSTTAHDIARIAQSAELEALAVGECDELCATHAPIGVDDSEAPIARLVNLPELEALQQGLPRLRALVVSELQEGDLQVTQADLASLSQARPGLLSLASRAGSRLSASDPEELEDEALAAIRASFAQDPEARESAGQGFAAWTGEYATEAQLEQLQGLDEETLVEGCRAIWEDVSTMEEIALQPRDEVEALLDILGLL